jgi:hypothetical protein
MQSSWFWTSTIVPPHKPTSTIVQACAFSSFRIAQPRSTTPSMEIRATNCSLIRDQIEHFRSFQDSSIPLRGTLASDRQLQRSHTRRQSLPLSAWHCLRQFQSRWHSCATGMGLKLCRFGMFGPKATNSPNASMVWRIKNLLQESFDHTLNFAASAGTKYEAEASQFRKTPIAIATGHAYLQQSHATDRGII